MTNDDRQRPAPAFVHVPKAAGSSFIDALRLHYGREDVEVVPGLGWPRDPSLGADVPSSKVVAGHILRGPATEGRPVVSMIRHPAARARSAMRYLMARPRNPLAPLALEASSLPAFVDAAGVEFDNGQVRRLVPGGDDLDDAELRRAFQRLVAQLRDGGMAIGVQEEFDRSLLHLADHLSWRRPPYYWTTNITTAPAREVAAPADDEGPTLGGELDLELWHLCRELVADNVPAGAVDGFRAGLRRSRLRRSPRMAVISARARVRKARKRRARG